MWEHKRLCLSWHQYDLQVCAHLFDATLYIYGVCPKNSLERDGKLRLQKGHALEYTGFGVPAFPWCGLLQLHLQLHSSPPTGDCCDSTVAQAAWVDGWGRQEKKDSCSSEVPFLRLKLCLNRYSGNKHMDSTYSVDTILWDWMFVKSLTLFERNSNIQFCKMAGLFCFDQVDQFWSGLLSTWEK